MVDAQAERGHPTDGDDDVDLVIEIPAGTRNKYEIDHETGRLRLERQLPASLVYPADYGFIPETVASDGDPLDALLLIDDPTVPGCTVRVRPVGVLWLHDTCWDDPKIITLLPERAERDGVLDLADLPKRTLEELEHSFQTYKDLEPGTHTSTRGFGDRSEALGVIAESRKRAADRR